MWSQGIRGILFDLDDTLVRSSEADTAALRATAQEFLHLFDGRSLDDVVAQHARVLAEVKRDFHAGKPWQFPPARFARMLQAQGLNESVGAQMGAAYYRHRLELMRCYDGVKEFLAELAPRYPMAIVTNGPSSTRPGVAAESGAPAVAPLNPQRLILERVGIAHHFDPVIVAGEVGIRKPDPAIFELARAELDIPARDVLVVGDSYQMDVVPALALGMRAAHVTGAPGDARTHLFDAEDGPQDGACHARVPRVTDLRSALLG